MRSPSALPQACVHLALFRKHASPNASALQTHFFDKGDLRHALTTGQREDLLQVTHVHVIHVHVVHVHVIHVHVSHVQVVHVHVIYVQYTANSCFNGSIKCVCVCVAYDMKCVCKYVI